MGQVLTTPITSKYVEQKGKWNVRIGGVDMQGYRMNMEDAHNIEINNLNSQNNKDIFLGVYDGHAGTAASQYLSENLVDKIRNISNYNNHNDIINAIESIDKEYIDSVDDELKDNGSTCVCCILEGDETSVNWKLTVANVGDSRVILIKKSGEYICMTTDHKPEDLLEKERIIQAGGFVNMNRVDGQLAMSRAIGDYQYKTNESLTLNKKLYQ